MDSKKVSIWASVTLLIFLLFIGCGPKAGYIAVGATLSGRNAVDDGLSKAFDSKMENCKVRHKCLTDCAKAHPSVTATIQPPLKACFDKCAVTHKSKDLSYSDCMTASNEYKAMVIWRSYARPTITASARATFQALLLADKINLDKAAAKKQWVSLLKKGVCTLTKMVMDFKDLFPQKALVVLGYLDLVKGVTCK